MAFARVEAVRGMSVFIVVAAGYLLGTRGQNWNYEEMLCFFG
jgi:hypothetical protein